MTSRTQSLYLNPQANPLVHSISKLIKKRVKGNSDAKTHRKDSGETISKPLAFTVEAALDTLRANATRVTETKGSISDVKIVFPSELLTGLRAMFHNGRTYDFMIHSSTTQAASGGGVVAGYISWDPSAAAEWSALSALFDECRLRSSHLTWTTAYGVTSTAIAVQISLAPDFVHTGVASTFTPISRLAESTEFHIGVPGAGGSYTFRKSTRPQRRIYAPVSAPISSTIDEGFNGQWSFASNIVTTPSINFAFTVLRNIGRFRQRA